VSSKNKDIALLADVFRRETLDGTITRLRLDQLKPSEYQPRQDRLREIDELAASIKRDGLLHPITVTKEGDSYSHGHKGGRLIQNHLGGKTIPRTE